MPDNNKSTFLPAPSSHRILIVKPSSFGDIIHTLPVLKTLRSTFPSAYIAWIVEESFREILDGNTDLNEIIPVSTKRWRRELTLKSADEIWKTTRRLRSLRFNIAIDLQGLLKSGVITWLSNASCRTGFNKSDLRESVNALFTNNKAEPAQPSDHAIERGLSLLKSLGIKDFKRDFGLCFSDKDDESAKKFFCGLSIKKPLVAVNSGFGFRTKEWEPGKYAALCDRLIEALGCSVLLTWGPGEKEKIERIAKMMKETPLVPPPTTIRESASYFNRCDLFIGSDTGPMHLCVALGIKTLVLMGSTNPSRNGPFGSGHTVIQKDIPCKNCYLRKCDSMECMKSITVDEVFEAASGILLPRLT